MAPRLRKADTPPEIWTAHRKLRKKIASAKWYAKKKKREIREQNRHRRELEAALQQSTHPWIWVDAWNRAYWRCVVEHHVRGYPPRSEDVDPHTYLQRVDAVEERIRTTRHQLRHEEWARYVPWDDDLGFVRILRQLGWRDEDGTLDWVTGPEGVWLAGCIRFVGGDVRTGWDMARAVFHTRNVHPTHAHTTNQAVGPHPPTTPPSKTPHQNADHDIQRWIAHTLLFPPSPSAMHPSWYDSDEEEDWLREWNAETTTTDHLPPTTTRYTEEDSQNSLPSSLDHFVDEIFQPNRIITQPPTPDYDADQHEGSGAEDSDADESDDSASQPHRS